jgi:hypothetical protein
MTTDIEPNKAIALYVAPSTAPVGDSASAITYSVQRIGSDVISPRRLLPSVLDALNMEHFQFESKYHRYYSYYQLSFVLYHRKSGI